jgi:hypothetical protein
MQTRAVTSLSIALPTDDEETIKRKTTEQLKRDLREMIKTPQQRRFEELYNQGFDKEVAAELAELDDVHMADSVIEAASVHEVGRASTSYEVAAAAAYETNRSARAIGSTAGAAIGSAVGMSAIKFATRHVGVVTLAGAAGASVALAIVAGKYVSAAFGAKVAAVAVANVLAGGGLVSLALWRLR